MARKGPGATARKGDGHGQAFPSCPKEALKILAQALAFPGLGLRPSLAFAIALALTLPRKEEQLRWTRH